MDQEALETIDIQLNSGIFENLVIATETMRNLTSRPTLRIDAIMQRMPKFIFLLEQSFRFPSHIYLERIQVQQNIAIALSNITKAMTGVDENRHIDRLAELSAIQVLLRLWRASSLNQELFLECMFALRNFCSDSATHRDTILTSTAGHLLVILSEHKDNAVERASLALIKSFCHARIQKRPNFNLVRLFIPHLSGFLRHHDKEIIAEACWALVYLVSGPTCQQVRDVIAYEGVLQGLVDLLG